MPPLQGRTVLIVEDSGLVRGLIRELLSAADVRILEASNATEAISVAEVAGQPAHVLITDLYLPDFGGVELAQRLQLRWPDLKILIISGDPGGVFFARAIPEAGFLEKTFLVERLLDRIQQLLETVS